MIAHRISVFLGSVLPALVIAVLALPAYSQKKQEDLTQIQSCFLLSHASTVTDLFGERTGRPSSLPTGTPDHRSWRVVRPAASCDVFGRQPVPTASDAMAGLFTARAALTTLESNGQLDEPSERPGETPPKVRHTGFKTLAFHTVSDFKAFPRRRSTWVILAIGGAAALLAHPVDDDVTEDLSGSEGAKDFFAAGKYIGSVPVQAGVAAGLFIFGRYGMHPSPSGSRTNRVSHLGFDLMRGLAVSQGLTQLVKATVRRDRPNGECCAFPSGHASAAFATASILERHFGFRGAWPTWIIASYVGASRLTDNRHFLSDVLFGAAVGVASGWTVVGRHGRSNFALIPAPTRGGVMISLVRMAGTP